MMDRTSKILMAAIAAGLFLNAAIATVRPACADDETDGTTLGLIAQELGDIARYLRAIETGNCQNKKLCE